MSKPEVEKDDWISARAQRAHRRSCAICRSLIDKDSLLRRKKKNFVKDNKNGTFRNNRLNVFSILIFSQASLLIEKKNIMYVFV